MFDPNTRIPVRPKTEEIQFLMECGYLNMEMGRHQEANDIFLGVAALCPDDPTPAAAITSVLLASGQVDDANDHIRKVMQAFPGNPLVMAHLGEVHLCRKETAAARDLFEKAREKDPAGPAGSMATAYLALLEEMDKP